MSDPNFPQGPPPPEGPSNTGPDYQGPQQPPYPQGHQPPPSWQPGQHPPQRSMTPQEARANARGAKAHAKAMRPWYKKKRFILPLVLIGIIIISQAFRGGGADTPTAGAPAATSTSAPAKKATKPAPEKTSEKDSKAPKPAAAGIGDKVSAGDWDFTVTKLDCGKKKVGSEYLDKKAQGQFCLMNIKVKNNGDQAETLDGDNQKLLDDKGREYSSDYEASAYADPDANLFLERINPGNTKKGLVVFDIPKDVKPVQAKLAGGLLGIVDVATIDLT